MRCEAYKGELEEAGGGTLSPAAAEHVGACEACARLRRERSALRGLLAGLPRVEAPADFEFRLRARIRASEGAPRRSLFARPAARAASAAVAACLVLLAAGVYLKRPERQAPQAEVSGADPEAPRAAQAEAVGTPPESARPKVESVRADHGPRATAVIHRGPEAKPSAKAEAGHGEAGEQTRTLALRSAPRLSRKGVEQGQVALSSTPVPLKLPAAQQPLRVILRDDSGAARVVSMRPVSFGSQQLVGVPRASFRPAVETKEGVW